MSTPRLRIHDVEMEDQAAGKNKVFDFLCSATRHCLPIHSGETEI
jgi:hypothetical protein